MKALTIKAFSVAVLLAVLTISTVAIAGEPLETVKSGVTKVTAILADANQSEKAKIASLKAATKDLFDYKQLSMMAVGKPWLDFTPKQQDDFTKSFSQLLEKSYFKKLNNFAGEQIEYIKELIEDKRAMVVTEVVTNDKRIPISYRMVNNDQWKVYDVIVEGISLVKNYKAQFEQILSTGTPDDLIARINKNIKEIDEDKA